MKTPARLELREFQLGDWQVRPRTRELSRVGAGASSHEQVRLKPRTIEVLLELVRHAGELRTREQLLAAVWGESFVGEEVLSHCIWELRRALGDDSRQPAYIETLHREGYRLLAPVRWLEAPPEAALGGKTSPVAPSPVSQSQAVSGSTPDPALDLLLQRVERYWLEQVLQQALEGSEILTPRLAPRPDAVRHAWGDLPHMAPDASDEDVSLLTLFRRAGHSLFLLGGAGSGKTVLLLRLAQEAVAAHRADPAEAVPVVLQLPSWADRATPLETWVEAEISHRYFLPRRQVRDWLIRGRLLLLLDGLDEVPEMRRSQCIDALDHFRDRLPLQQMVVTCRTAVADALTVIDHRPRLAAALEIEPLSEAQVAAALASTPASWRRWYQVAELGELARSPLLLSFLRRLQRDSLLRTPSLPTEPLSEDASTGQQAREQLLASFVRGCLNRSGGVFPPYPQRVVLRGLSVLARAMLDHQRSLFQLEELQPSWLQSAWRRRLYVLLSRLAIGLVLGVALGSIRWLAGVPGLPPVIVGALAASLLIAGLDLWLLSQPPAATRNTGGRFYALAVAGVAALGSFPVHELLQPRTAPVGPFLVTVFCAVLLRRHANDVRYDADIAAVETFRWSWSAALHGWLVAAAIVLPVMALAAIAGGADGGWMLLLRLLPNALINALLPACLLGLRRGLVDSKLRPNHGLWLWQRNVLLGAGILMLGLAVTLSAGQLVAMLGWLRQPPHLVLAAGLPTGQGFVVGLIACMALLGALGLGGVELIKHYVLRVLLWYGGDLPLRFPRWLAHVNRCALLSLAGGGYVFVHRTLQEYLASLSDASMLQPGKAAGTEI